MVPILAPARPSHVPAVNREEQQQQQQRIAPGIERERERDRERHSGMSQHRVLTPPPEEQESEPRETTTRTMEQKRGSWGPFGGVLRGKGEVNKPAGKVLSKASQLVEHPVVGGMRY